MNAPRKKTWLEKIAYDMGKTIHNIKRPVSDTQTTEVRRDVEEKKLNPTTTLRRTTIEEVEVKPND